MSRLKSITIAITLLAGGTAASAQAAVAPYKFDFGGALGMSGYIGDLNSGNPFRHPGFSADVRSAYVIDTRWAVRGVLCTSSLSGTSADITNVLPPGEQYSFTSRVWDLGVRGEFNFFSYGIGETYKRLQRCSPYVALGVGVGLTTANGGSPTVAASIPVALGVRFKLRERVNLFGELSMTKNFNDKVDAAADINHIKTDFYKNTDWTSRLVVGLTYEFGKRCEVCHYVD